MRHASVGVQQLGEVVDDDVGTVGVQRLVAGSPIDADDEPEAAGPAGGDAGDGVLDDDGRRRRRRRGARRRRGRGPAPACRRCARSPRSRRRRRPRSAAPGRTPRAPHARCATTTRPPPSCRAVARWSRRRSEPGYGAMPSSRSTVWNTSFLRFPSALTDRVARRLRLVALGKCDATRGEQRAHAVEARFAVDVGEVVGLRERGARRRGTRNSSNILVHARWCSSAVGVRTPSRSNNTASYVRQGTAALYVGAWCPYCERDGKRSGASRRTWRSANFPIANRPLDVRVARALATIKRHAAPVNALARRAGHRRGRGGGDRRRGPARRGGRARRRSSPSTCTRPVRARRRT